MSYSLWFNFMSLGHVLAKLLSIRSQVNYWRQTAWTTIHATFHYSCLNRAPNLFWASLYFFLVVLATFPTLKELKMHWSAFPGHRQCLVLVGWAGTFVCRLSRICVKQNFRVLPQTTIYVLCVMCYVSPVKRFQVPADGTDNKQKNILTARL